MAYVVTISEFRHEVREKVAKDERGADGRKLYASKHVKTFHSRTEADLFVAGQRVKDTVGERVKLSQGKVQMRVVVQAYIDEDLLQRPGFDAKHPSVYRCKSWLNKTEYSWLVDKSLAELTHEDIDELIEQRIGDDIEPATVNRELNILSPMFEFAMKKWRVKHWDNPVHRCDRPKVNDARNRTLSVAEREALETAFAASGAVMLHPAFVLAMETGIRRGELCKIEWRDVVQDGDNSHINLRAATTKTKKARTVPLSRRALQVVQFLEAWRTERQGREAALQKRRAVDEVYDFKFLLAGVSPRSIGQAFKRAVSTTTVEDFRFHDCRHCATTWLSEIFPMLELSQITGHTDPRMLARYYNPHGAGLAAKLNAKLAA